MVEEEAATAATAADTLLVKLSLFTVAITEPPPPFLQVRI
jgi:hypothetical protein